MISRRLFLLSLPVAPALAGCATLPPNATKRAGGVADVEAEPPAPWHPEPGDTTSAPPTKAPAAADGDYTCPMHPEVVSKTPGDCPKCGMPLVLKKGGSL